MSLSLRPRHELLRTRLNRVTRVLRGVESGEIRAVHRARVATRRLRELVPVLRIESSLSRKLMKRLRKATRGLGAVRELDVLELLVDELRATGRYPDGALRRLEADARARRARLDLVADGRDLGDRLRRLERRLAIVAEALERHEDPSSEVRGWRWALDARVARRAAALRSSVDAAGSVYVPERLHAVRIAVKKLRYAVELASDAGGGAAGRDLKSLERWQDLLGRLHDFQVLIERVHQIQAALPPFEGEARREQEELRVGLERTCRHLHARYVRERAAILELSDRLAARRLQARRAG
jgi:CHAD domain-containing protein